MVRVAINGFGRIGRMLFRAGFNDPSLEWVAINDIADTKTLAHLLKYDSVHGPFPGEVKSSEKALIVNGKEIPVYAEKDPSKLPWKEKNVHIVVECSGQFNDKEKAALHLIAGAKKVLISAPGKGVDITLVLGVNEKLYDKNKHHIISNASCTTNCLAPIAKVLHEKFGIESGFMNTVHAFTADQRLVDSPHKDFRRARSSLASIIPTTTGAAKTVGEVIPELKGKLDGIALRVPVSDGSVVDLVCQLKKETTAEEINTLFKNASQNELKGILEYTDEPIVSVDIIHNPHSCIIDGLSTNVMNGKFVKILGWYDNEWGYSCRMIDVLKLL